MTEPVAIIGRRPAARHLAAIAALLSCIAGSAQAADPPRAAACASADTPAGPRLVVQVIGARRVAGNITITLYGDQQEAFLARTGRLARQRVPLAGPAAEACFVLAAPGAYAIAVYHDENDDHDFNRTLIGMPAEGYGFSNDAPTALGLPAFSDVLFQVPPSGARITIRLRYRYAPSSAPPP